MTFDEIIFNFVKMNMKIEILDLKIEVKSWKFEIENSKILPKVKMQSEIRQMKDRLKQDFAREVKSLQWQSSKIF